MKRIKKAIFPYFITILTLLPYTDYTSILVDKMLVEIEAD